MLRCSRCLPGYEWGDVFSGGLRESARETLGLCTPFIGVPVLKPMSSSVELDFCIIHIGIFRLRGVPGPEAREVECGVV